MSSSRDEGVRTSTAASGPAAPSLVGIGASAGGISALREFFHDVPAESGITFVVVLHLAPAYESNLAEVLQPHVRMPVRKVEERVRMEPNHVYVIPQNRTLAVTDGHLDIAEFRDERERHGAIDFFFRTVAQAHPEGIGVLLSGSGSDGSLGMRAIKEHGGVILAQSPDEAEYPEMPRNIIATGLVDFVLPARELGARVVQLRAPVWLPVQGATLAADVAAVVHEILLELKRRTGQDLTGYKKSTVLRRIARRMRVTQRTDLRSYAQQLKESSSEPEALLNDLLLSVTSFFRDSAVFDALDRDVIPALLGRALVGDVLRIWVAGCATGEEAYSIAMLVDEHASRMRIRPEVQIFASDLDEDAIAKARDGVFPAAAATDLSDERIERFFWRESAHLRVRKELRDTILFTKHNVLQDPPFSRVDLISCRNLLIYLDRGMQNRVIDLFHYALREEGFLVLGTSESIDAATTRFHAVDRAARIYQRKSITRRPADWLADFPLARPGRQRHEEAAMTTGFGMSGPRLELHRAALEAHAPPSVLVDEHSTIVHVSPTANRFLQFSSGSPTAHVLKSVRGELQHELRAALFQALQKKRPTQTQLIPMQLDGAASGTAARVARD